MDVAVIVEGTAGGMCVPDVVGKCDVALHGLMDARCRTLVAELSDLSTNVSLQWTEETQVLSEAHVAEVSGEHSHPTSDGWEIASEVASEGVPAPADPSGGTMPWMGGNSQAPLKIERRAGCLVGEQLDVVKFGPDDCDGGSLYWSVGEELELEGGQVPFCKVSSSTSATGSTDSWQRLRSPELCFLPVAQSGCCAETAHSQQAKIRVTTKPSPHDKSDEARSNASIATRWLHVDAGGLPTDTARLEGIPKGLAKQSMECFGDVEHEADIDSDEESVLIINDCCEAALDVDFEVEDDFSDGDSVVVIDDVCEEAPSSACFFPNIETDPREKKSFVGRGEEAPVSSDLGAISREQCLQHDYEIGLHAQREMGQSTALGHERQVREHLALECFLAGFEEGETLVPFCTKPRSRQRITRSVTTGRAHSPDAQLLSSPTTIDFHPEPAGTSEPAFGALCLTSPSCWMKAISGLWRCFALLTSRLC
uniref:Uncharacterized protein n=1 Tax=Noctiluca scintillans TaxID=2966 RepID=A0A7S1FK71_NOCSC